MPKMDFSLYRTTKEITKVEGHVLVATILATDFLPKSTKVSLATLL
jgi:hypothetical protein